MKPNNQNLTSHAPDSDIQTAPQFTIGYRNYFVSRTRDSNGWRIVANGDLVEQISSRYFGDIVAFQKLATRLVEIESAWADNSKSA